MHNADPCPKPKRGKGTTAGIKESGNEGEDFIRHYYQGSMKKTFETSTGETRLVDVYRDNTIHEVKVGYQGTDSEMSRQIAKDKDLIANGRVKASVWHFLPSHRNKSSRMGPSKPLLKELQDAGISVQIHLPGPVSKALGEN